MEPEKTRDIDLRRFVPVDELEPMYFERAYYLAPAGDSTKAYRLLAAVMEETGRAGIATFVMRTKEYLIAILAENGILRAETLRFHDEVRPVSEIGLPDRPSIPSDLEASMRAAVRERAEEELDEAELADDYAERLRALVESKKEERGAVKTAPAAVDEETGGGDVIDLMEVLKRSLQGGEAAARKPRRSGPGSSGAGSDGARSEALAQLTRDELYERAKALEISGRSSMTKAELADAIGKSA